MPGTKAHFGRGSTSKPGGVSRTNSGQGNVDRGEIRDPRKVPSYQNSQRFTTILLRSAQIWMSLPKPAPPLDHKWILPFRRYGIVSGRITFTVRPWRGSNVWSA